MKTYLLTLLLVCPAFFGYTQWQPTNSSASDNSNIYHMNGNVGIKTSSPSAILDIQSNVGINAFRIQGGLPYNTYFFDITSFFKAGDVGYSFSIKNPWGMVNDALSFYQHRVGIGTNDPQTRLHVDGTVGVGRMGTTQHPGLKVEYTEDGAGSGTTVFTHQRWGGNFHFKRNSAAGEISQLFFGGAGNHYMDIYNQNNEVKVKLSTSGDSYFDGGNVGIGTTTPGSFRLAVNGKIWSQEVNVAMTNPGPDYVFEKEYHLLPLSELETYITQNKHLPEVPSAKEMEADGLNLKDMNLILLKKVEELTLHLIDVNRRVAEQQKEIDVLKNKTLNK